MGSLASSTVAVFGFFSVVFTPHFLFLRVLPWFGDQVGHFGGGDIVVIRCGAGYVGPPGGSVCA